MPADFSGSIYNQYEQAMTAGEEALKRNELKKAGIAYEAAAKYLRNYAEFSSSDETKNRWRSRADELDKYSEKLMSGKLPTPPTNNITEKETSPKSEFESEILNFIEKPNISWDEIAGLSDTKDAIKIAYGMTQVKIPSGIKVVSLRNLMLYGPPGTGKTLLAAATASNLEATFFNVKVSNLVSKYFGESTKIISALYDHAKAKSPSVIFLDEFDALVPPRDGELSGAETKIVSTFLAELDGLSGKEDKNYVLTIGATNVPWNIDGAILRRFQKRVLVPLPDKTAREKILEINIHKNGHTTDVSLTDLVNKTEGFSGRGIRDLCESAITRMIQRSNPNIISIVDSGRDQLNNYELVITPLIDSDFAPEFKNSNHISVSMIEDRYKQWQKLVQN